MKNSVNGSLRKLLGALACLTLVGSGSLAANVISATPASAKSPVSSTCSSGTLSYAYKDAETAAMTVNHELTTPSKIPVTTSKVRNTNWQLLNRTTGAVLDEGLTDATTGAFTACRPSSTSASSVVIQFESASSGLWRTISSNSRNAQTYIDEHDLNGTNFGDLVVAADKAAAFKIIDTVSDLWGNRANPTTNCWVASEKSGSCTPITFAWGQSVDRHERDRADTGYWDLGGTEYVVIGSNSVQSKHTILHEAGHAWQDLLHQGFPQVYYCENHYFKVASSKSCAWTEGWADSVAAFALGDTKYVFSDGQFIDLGPTATGDNGPDTQVRIDATLLQLWSGPDGGLEKTTKAMGKSIQSCFREYYEAREPADRNAQVAQILTNNTLDPNDVSSCY